MDYSEPFGKILKRMRGEKRWTLRDVAEKVETNFAYLSQLEAGIAKPSEVLVERIADAFGLKGKDRESLIFVARNIPEQIKEIKEKFPNVAPQFFRRVAKKDQK